MGTSEMLHAPHLLDAEIAQVIRRFTLSGEIDEERGRVAMEDFMVLPIHRHPHDFLLPRVWTMRNNFSAYDAMYVALAEVLDASLITHDRRLALAARRYTTVELI